MTEDEEIDYVKVREIVRYETRDAIEDLVHKIVREEVRDALKDLLLAIAEIAKEKQHT
jgi:hypothetical protein